ncbi:MAG: DNA translocase FtsK [Minisyncoccia bacterium]
MKKIREKRLKEKEEEEEPEKKLPLEPEIKNSILAITLFVLAIILILSAKGLAGPVGIFVYRIFNYLLGWGYFFLPFLLFFLVYRYFKASLYHFSFNLISLFGVFLSLFSFLSLIDIFFPRQGGFFGKIGGFLKLYLGIYASVIIYSAAFIVGFILIFRFPLRLPKRKIKEEITVTTYETEQLPIEKEKEKKEEKETRKEEKIEEKIEEKRQKFFLKALKIKSGYKLPPIDLLNTDSSHPTAGDIRANANIIKRTLESFGIEVEMGEVNVGPTVTQYTLKPAEGVKLSSITALHNDLALALAAHPIRIEAPIPGKSMVGIEVPNRSIALVRLGNLLKEIDFLKNPLPLIFPLGRDVKGEVILTDLTEMPHLLVAGATGTGKSVCLHSLLSSFLIKNSPETLRLVLIDPKRVEMSRYNGIPHLLTPVITDHKKVIPVFKWVVLEMEKRYELLAQNHSRDIESYNRKIIEKGEKEIMPYIVLVIDELADLMIYYGRDLESFIVRIAQMARATGIHLIVSTQRPSVEVITGLIKANITHRIAFQVASQVDSRTILDCAGAEKLLGHGDMLYLSPLSSRPRRIQGAYISEKEIDALVKFINEQKILISQENGLKEELEGFIEEKEKGMIDFESLEVEEDELYSQAYETVVRLQKASASLLQRKLKIGYARAARLLDILEEKGVIGPGEGAKPRQVFVKREDLDESYLKNQNNQYNQ